jgi:predicted RNA-binding Zn-ribbon protein involved in translation (DUF1610 family)
MGFFQRIGNAMARFMYGRNGMDQLNRALLTGYLILFALQMLTAGILRSVMLTRIVDLLLWVVMILVMFRMFSRNLPKRREENQKWVSWWYQVKSRNSGARARHADKDHKYFTCKSCGAICRVPVGKGKIIITCPKCGGKIEAKT